MRRPDLDDGAERKELQGPRGLARGMTGDEHLGRGFGPKRPKAGRLKQLSLGTGREGEDMD